MANKIESATEMTWKRNRRPRTPDHGRYINILLDNKTIEQVDDFRFSNRMPSRNETMRWLLVWALNQNPSCIATEAEQIDLS